MQTEPLPMNLRVLAPSRKRRKPGEIFAFSVREHEYYWGRVVSTEMNVSGWRRIILIYLYNNATTNLDSIPVLSKHSLLVPPLGTVNLLWSRGFFQTVAMLPLVEGDVFAKHCFYSLARRGYFDEHGNAVEDRSERCGTYGVTTPYGVDCEVSRALGIPLAPNEGKGQRW